MQKTRFGDISAPFLAVKTSKKMAVESHGWNPPFLGRHFRWSSSRSCSSSAAAYGTQSRPSGDLGSSGMPKFPQVLMVIFHRFWFMVIPIFLSHLKTWKRRWVRKLWCEFFLFILRRLTCFNLIVLNVLSNMMMSPEINIHSTLRTCSQNQLDSSESCLF